MTHKELMKLHELKGRLQAQADISRNDVRRSVATLAGVKSDYYKGYYQAETDTHEYYAQKFERLLAEVCQIIRGVQDD